MVEAYRLFLNFDIHLHSNALKSAQYGWAHIPQIVVAHYEVYLAVQSVKNVVPAGSTSKGKISQVEYNVVLADHTIPVANQCLVHLLNIGKWTLTIIQDVDVVEVRVACEEQAIGLQATYYCFHIVFQFRF